MALRQYDTELVARNYAHSLQIAPEVIQSWDEGLWRGPRLLVPIRVNALVVTQQNAAGPWASVKLNPHAIPGYSDHAPDEPEGDSENVRPEPFETYDGRPAGVHLHWALPDGLTKGRQTPLPVEAPPEAGEADTAQVETEEAPPETDTEFPLIPDRWLVARMYAGTGDDRRRRLKAWVIESEEHEPESRVTPLEQWREDRSDEKRARWMTALGLGDPAYAAYYDNVKDVLGFHDSLEDGERGPLTYLVMGWYSHQEDDPLYQPGSLQAWLAKLEELGWTLEGAREEQEARVKQAADETSRRLAETGLKMNYEAIAGAALTRQVEADVAQPGKMFLGKGMLTVAEASEAALVTDRNELAHYWPRQLLCHGMVVGVAWDGAGAAVPGLDERPAARNLQLALGNTAIEALSAMVAKQGARADLDKIVSAFHFGMLGELQQTDGLAALESLLHAEDFLSKPGGYVVDTIEEGDLFPRPAQSEVATHSLSEAYDRVFHKKSSLLAHELLESATLAEPPPAYYIEEEPKAVSFAGTGRYGVNLAFEKDHSVLQELAFDYLKAKYRPDIRSGIEQAIQESQRRKVHIRRAMPRYFEPRDPVVLFGGAGRAFKHGEDGIFTEEGKLVCRLTGETVYEMSVIIGEVTAIGEKVRAPVAGILISSDDLLSGQIPPECPYLYAEALFLDHTNAPIIADALAGAPDYLAACAPADSVTWYDLSAQALETRVCAEATMVWQPVMQPEADEQALLALSGMSGRRPSPLCYHVWRQPWTPLHLAWEVEWHPSPQGVGDWKLAETELEPRDEESFPGTVEEPFVYSDRTLITPAIARLVAGAITKFLEEEEEGAEGLVTGAEEEVLDAALAELQRVDTMACSLGGLHEQLLGLEEIYYFTPGDEGGEPGIEETTRRKEGAPVYAVRAGHLKLKRLRLIDAFGRFVDVPNSLLSAPVRAGDVTAPDPDLIRLPPRIVQPSRLMFRLLRAGDDTRDATKENGPVCGWLVPDHLDEALEVYDSLGINQGQVQLRSDEAGLEWLGVPGQASPLGAPPNLANQHLQRFVQGLLVWGLQDVDTLKNGLPLKESALSAFLRMTDATLWTVDPLGREGGEHLSVLVGRPLAVVRAQLRLELESEPAVEELMRTPFQVRLGALTRLHDGLVGYFVNDDYGQYYPVHEVIAEQTRTTRPRSGFLGAIQTVPGFYQSFGQSTSVDPVEHPYINKEPTVRIRPGQTVSLTLLVDPRGGVHATCGILPRKRIELMREHVAEALDNISITFRVGPILTDPETIRMPLPAEIKGGWSWVRRTGPNVWEEGEVVNETGEARLTPTPAQIQEGWLKLSGALKEGEQKE